MDWKQLHLRIRTIYNGYILEVTTVEAMGNATVTPEDFEYICTAMKISALICVSG